MVNIALKEVTMTVRLFIDQKGREVYRVETPSGVIGLIAADVPIAALDKLIAKLTRKLARRRRATPPPR